VKKNWLEEREKEVKIGGKRGIKRRWKGIQSVELN